MHFICVVLLTVDVVTAALLKYINFTFVNRVSVCCNLTVEEVWFLDFLPHSYCNSCSIILGYYVKFISSTAAQSSLINDQHSSFVYF